PAARVAVENIGSAWLVTDVGEVTTEAYVEIPQIVLRAVSAIGYASSSIGFDGHSCGVQVSIGQQCRDIASGVDTSWESRAGERRDPFDDQGAGDQGFMVGYASDDTPQLMPQIGRAHV